MSLFGDCLQVINVPEELTVYFVDGDSIFRDIILLCDLVDCGSLG